MSSPALRDLSSRLDEVKTLTALDPARAGDVSKWKESSAISRACILFLSAHLEGFLEDLGIQYIDELVSRAIHTDKVPVLMRSLQANSHVRIISNAEDPIVKAGKIQAMFSQENKLWDAGVTLSAGMLRSSVLCSEMSNPGSREIERFMRFLDVDIRQHLQSLGQAALLNQINGLIAKRNLIAHGSRISSVSRVDVDTYLQIVNDLCQEIDQATAASLMRVCALPALPW